MATRFVAYSLAAALSACQTSQPLQTELPLVKQMSVNGTNLAYVEEGQGEVVLFIHGANGDWRTWDELRPLICVFRTIVTADFGIVTAPFGRS
jgi:hypothetical protein